MSEKKRYKLVIPEMIKKKDAHLVNNLGSGATVVHDRNANDSGYICCYLDEPEKYYPNLSDTQYKFPEDWLEEIPSKPQTAEEWLQLRYDLAGSEYEDQLFSGNEMIKAHKAGQEMGARKYEQAILKSRELAVATLTSGSRLECISKSHIVVQLIDDLKGDE